MTRSKIDLESLSADELWDLHQKIKATLEAKIEAQKKVLEHQLVKLNARLRAK
jgi:hypothetical protein